MTQQPVIQTPASQPLALPSRMLIGGELVPGHGPATDVLNPATGAVLQRLPEASTEQVDAAVRAAGAAFSGWAGTTPKDRSALLL